LLVCVTAFLGPGAVEAEDQQKNKCYCSHLFMLESWYLLAVLVNVY